MADAGFFGLKASWPHRVAMLPRSADDPSELATGLERPIASLAKSRTPALTASVNAMADHKFTDSFM